MHISADVILNLSEPGLSKNRFIEITYLVKGFIIFSKIDSSFRLVCCCCCVFECVFIYFRSFASCYFHVVIRREDASLVGLVLFFLLCLGFAIDWFIFHCTDNAILFHRKDASMAEIWQLYHSTSAMNTRIQCEGFSKNYVNLFSGLRF